MSDALKLWLRECWELWYWAMFCPSRLQERMNEWSPAEERNGVRPDTTVTNILFSQINWRFLLQFIQVSFCLSLPLVAIIPIYGRSLDWLLLPVILILSYGSGFWHLPISLNVPLIFISIYLAKPTFFIIGITKAIEVLPPLSQMFFGLSIGTFGLFITNIIYILILGYSSFKKKLLLSKYLVIAGYAISLIIGSWISTQNWLFALVTGSGMFLSSFYMEKRYENRIKVADDDDSVKPQFSTSVSLIMSVAIVVEIIVTFSIVFSFLKSFAGLSVGILVYVAVLPITMFSGIGVFLGFVVFIPLIFPNRKIKSRFARTILFIFDTTIVLSIAVCITISITVLLVGCLVSSFASISTLELPIFLFIWWLIVSSLSPYREISSVINIAIILFLLRNGHQIWEIWLWEILLAIPVTLIGYYRLFPDFVMFTIFSLFVIPILYCKNPNIFQFLYLLPPFTSELLWLRLPLPNHDRLLIAAFRQNPLEAIPIFQSIQKQPLYGFQQTIKNALPQLVADQLIAVHTIPELITTATPNHVILPLLVPSLYQTELVDTQSPNVELLPTFQKYAQNIEAALQAGSIALRERGLERILDQLSTLNSQLSGLVKSKSIPRWQAVIKQWQTIIQQELEQLQRQSQGEILNPFQYGNPLTRDRVQLFKGRSAFADQIVRQILDRNRPTIILHGPRRCGKSSFLLNLPRLLTSDVLPVYIDLQSQSASQSEADFCFTIVRAIHRDARSQQVHLPAPPKREEFRLSPYTQLEDWLDTALTQLGDRRILLNIDEFEAIGTAMEQGRISTNLFDELRSLIQHWDRLSFLFSGVQTLDELGTNWSSYFISAMPIEMTYLNPNEARELLENPDPEFTLEYDTGIVDQILTLTRCHPYLLQLLGWVLVQLANTTHTQLVTPTLLQSAIPEAYINGIGYFTNVWEQFTGTSPTEIIAGQQQLLALSQGQQPHPTDEAAQKSLQRMLRYHIIEKINNQYKFEVPLIERWVREKAS